MHNRGMVKRVKKPENVALGKRIKIAREKAGLVQADFAREFGVSIITVSRWETGAQAPNDKTKRRIAEISNTTLAYLLSETDDLVPVHHGACPMDTGSISVFAERLEAARKAKKLSQEELGKAVGLSRYPVMDWEAHRKTPDIQMASRLAECLEVSLFYLLGETDDPTFSCFDGNFFDRVYKSVDETSPQKMHNIDFLTWIPVISSEVKVSAGTGNCCEEIVWEEIDRFPLFDGKIAALYSDNGLLSIHVDGDSMEPQIHDGDLVIFKRSQEWVSGNIVVVCLDGRLMVKGIVKGPEGETRLRSLKKEYEDIIIGKASFFLVYGRVLKIVRQWDPKPVL